MRDLGAERVAELEPPVDDEALLAAMTLVPGVYSRNRMFDLYERRASAKQLRTRAARLRGLVRTWLERADSQLDVTAREGGYDVVLTVPSLSFRRRLHISELEHVLLALLFDKAKSRAGRTALPVRPEDRQRVERALSRLSG